MTARILHAPTRAAFEAAAPNQTAKLTAVRNAFAGNVTVRIEGAGGLHLRTVTIPPLTINSATPRGLVCSATVLADLAVNPSTPGSPGIAPVRWEFRDGSTPIFDTDEIAQAVIKALCMPRLGGVVFTVDPSLPVDVDYIKAPPAGVSNLAALIGDSNTEHSFRSTQAYWRNGLLGGVLDMRANSGKSGVAILDLITQVDELYTNGSNAGLQGLPPLGWVFLQFGTNGWRGVTTVTSTMRSQFTTLVNKLKLVAEHVVIITMPPAGGVTTPRAAGYPVVRSYFQEFVLADTSNRTHLIDGWGDTIDSAGNIIPVFWLVDEYHPSGAGARQVALSELAQMQALLANQSYARAPLVTSPADVFPAQPQWINNPAATGSVAVTGAWTGNLPTGWNIGNNGTGLAGTVAIIPAAVGDPNQVPWVRITPTTSSSFAQISLTFAASGRALTTSDPSELEQLVEVRFNSLLNFNQLEFWAQNMSGNKFTQTAYLRWGATIPPTETVVLRQRYYRDNLIAGGTPLGVIYLYSVVAASGSMGSIDIRCPSIRG